MKRLTLGFDAFHSSRAPAPNPSARPLRRSTVRGIGTPSRSPPPERPVGPDADLGERSTIVPDFNLQDLARSALPVGVGPTIDQAPLHTEAYKLSHDCQQAVERDCLFAIGSELAILVVAVSRDQLKGYALDHVSGFLLSVMDGATDLATILDISDMPRLDALRRLRNLVERGIVVVRCDAGRAALGREAF